MFKWLTTLLDRLFAVGGALLFSQIPLFMQQYTQQLSGHEAELHLQIDLIQKTAFQTGKTLDQFIHKFLSSSDPDFMHQGELMQGMVIRWHHLVEALTSLQESTFLTRPFVFMRHCDFEICKNTLKAFQMGIPLNLEGGLYAFVGIIAGFLIFFIIRQLLFFPSKVKTTLHNT